MVHEWLVYRREVMQTPLRTLAAEIGISRGAVDQFHKLRSYPRKNWPKLRDWYMRTRQKEIGEYETPPELLLTSALNTLVTLPLAQRSRALRRMADHHRSTYEELHLPLPKWVQMLVELADNEGAD